jgi:hypothetical protein
VFNVKKHKYLLDGTRLKLSISHDQVTKNKWESVSIANVFGVKKHKYLLDGSRLKLSIFYDQVTQNKWESFLVAQG